MKRDMDLVRSILLKVESAQEPIDIDDLFDDAFSPEVITYHIDLMMDRGLLDGYIKRDWNGDLIDGRIDGLTWNGQDFLDAMRDMRVWTKARKAIKESIGSCTFETIKAVCVQAATQLAITQLGK